MGIVVLTMYAGDDQLFGALEAGASAFVPKTAPADEVVAAARHAASAPSAFTAADLAEAMKRRLAPSGPQLSPREGQVLRLLADGMSVAGIAKQLFVSRVDRQDPHLEALREAGRGQPGPGADDRAAAGPARGARRPEVLRRRPPRQAGRPRVPALALTRAGRRPTPWARCAPGEGTGRARITVFAPRQLTGRIPG